MLLDQFSLITLYQLTGGVSIRRIKAASSNDRARARAHVLAKFEGHDICRRSSIIGEVWKQSDVSNHQQVAL